MPTPGPNISGFDLGGFEKFVREAPKNRGSFNEQQMRSRLLQALTEAYRDVDPKPWWVTSYISGEEHQVQTVGTGRRGKRGHVDVVIGSTAIEYEADLQKKRSFDGGLKQVREYCAGLINQGHEPTTIYGVLSDTVQWYAYTVNIPTPQPASLGPGDVTLNQDGEIDLSNTGMSEAARATALDDFLKTYLGDEGRRPLTAQSIAEYFGPEVGTGVGYGYAQKARNFVDAAFKSDTGTKDAVEWYWGQYVKNLAADPNNSTFDLDAYSQELYATLLAKLLCANIIEGKGLNSDDTEMKKILTGRFFEDHGVLQFVEDDYFGWAHSQTHFAGLKPIAHDLQLALLAFDYSTSPDPDLFGELATRLAGREQRILLGQGTTPAWIADEMAEWMFSELPEGDAPRFLDMTCGSGALLVAVVRQVVRNSATLSADPDPDELDALIGLVSTAATGFDIDPLAVILAKANWVLAVRDVLKAAKSHGRFLVPPIYNADSLTQVQGANTIQLQIGTVAVTVPQILNSAQGQRLFDGLLDLVAKNPTVLTSSNGVQTRASESGVTLSGQDLQDVSTFAQDLSAAISAIPQPARRPMWVSVARNAYRPGMVGKEFNGIISNPPWLALSKIKKNPFSATFKELAGRYGIKSAGSSAGHQETANIFLCTALERYLVDGGTVAYLLPDTVRNGRHQIPFRNEVTKKSSNPHWALSLHSIWETPKEAFPNRAVVLCGKGTPTAGMSPGDTVSGRAATPSSLKASKNWHIAEVDGNHYWLEASPPSVSITTSTLPFKQGADLMPRTTVFFEVQPPAGSSTQITIDSHHQGSPGYYLIQGAKKAKNFAVSSRNLPQWTWRRAITSNQLAPFFLDINGADAILPVETSGNGWGMRTENLGTPARNHFEDVRTAAGDPDIAGLAHRLNYRNKITNQTQPVGKHIVVFGAGGGTPAAAFWKIATADDRRLVDQTLYWLAVDTEEEALYLTGMINSQAVEDLVKLFLPAGNFDERHLHTWPIKVVAPYDSSLQSYQDVVTSTRALIQAALANQTIQDLISSKPLIGKRSAIRRELQTLPCFGHYDNACRAAL